MKSDPAKHLREVGVLLMTRDTVHHQYDRMKSFPRGCIQRSKDLSTPSGNQNTGYIGAMRRVAVMNIIYHVYTVHINHLICRIAFRHDFFVFKFIGSSLIHIVV
ncbi:hypothetical protein SDC9_64022 [bioreactor metagenome]|uniref:Uncharacterized protein n=1 Tax=bioreactor metagenome TaxID=1076179 RepID=A0A644XNA6_9ZZZZ